MNIPVLIRESIFGKVDRNFYTENKQLLAETNYRLLKKAYLFSLCMCFFLFVLTFFNELIGNLKVFYLIFTVFFLGATLFVFLYVKNHKNLSNLFFYIFACAILSLAADISTIKSPDVYAVTFYVFLIIIPMLHVGRPIYAVILAVCACIGFCLLTNYVKAEHPQIAANDILNAICCCFVGIGLNITFINLQLENLQAKANLEHISFTDELTLLPNRRSLNLYAKGLFESRHDNISIVMMDIDNFKSFNDIFGHLDGDECLRRVGALLQAAAAQYSLFIARFGGEEFVAVSTTYDLSTIGTVCDDIVRSVEALAIQNGLSPLGRVTISAGYADLKSSEASSYMELVNCADDALYVSKTNGKNRATPYEKAVIRR